MKFSAISFQLALISNVRRRTSCISCSGCRQKRCGRSPIHCVERHRLRIEIHAQEAAPLAERHAEERIVVLAEVRGHAGSHLIDIGDAGRDVEALKIGSAEQLAVEAVSPAMIRTADDLAVGVFGHQPGRAVPADVVECAQLAVAIAHDDAATGRRPPRPDNRRGWEFRWHSRRRPSSWTRRAAARFRKTPRCGTHRE